LYSKKYTNSFLALGYWSDLITLAFHSYWLASGFAR